MYNGANKQTTCWLKNNQHRFCAGVLSYAYAFLQA